MIRAEAHSDDRVISVKFDATAYFTKASDASIMAIVKCGYSGDYPTDAIASDYPDDGSEAEAKLRELFTYVDMVGRTKDMGFECSVDEADVLLWVKSNRPTLMDSITEHYHTMIDDDWKFPA